MKNWESGILEIDFYFPYPERVEEKWQKEGLQGQNGRQRKQRNINRERIGQKKRIWD